MRWLLTSLLAGGLCAVAIHAPDRWLASLLVGAALAVLAIVGFEAPAPTPEPDSPLAEWVRPSSAKRAGKAVHHA